MSAEAAGIDDCIVDGKGAGVSLNWSLIGGDLYAVDYASIVGASISVVCCLIIMGSYFRSAEIRRHPNELIFFRTMMDLVFALTVVVQYVYFETSHESWASFACSDMCRVLAFVTQFSVLGAEIWFFTVSLDLFLALRNPFTNYKRNQRFYTFAMLAACLGTATFNQLEVQPPGPGAGLNTFHLCWVQPQNVGLNAFMWVGFYMPVLGMYGFAMFVLYYANTRLREGLRQTYQTRKAVFERGKTFLVAYILYWAMEQIFWGIFFFNDTLKPDANTRDISKRAEVAIFVFTFSGRGFVTFFLWAKELDLRGALCPRDGHEELESDRYRRGLQPHLNQALRAEMLHYTRSVIRLSVLQADYVGTDSSSFRVKQNSGLGGMMRRQGGNMVNQWRDLETKGHEDTIDEIDDEEATQAGVELDVEAAPSSSSRGAATTAGSGGAGAASGSPAVAHVGAASIPGPKHRLKRPPMHMQDLAPQLFSQIRSMFGISGHDYMQSLSKTINERFSEGASGAFMCMSHDQKYVVKTMSREESEVLRRILPKYVKYLRANPDTLISKFFGCCALKLYKKQLYFVVMENIFHTDNTIHERYDLKGSWVNRNAGSVSKGTKSYCRYCNAEYIVDVDKTQCRARPNRPHTPATVLKDNDLNFKIRLDDGRAHKLGMQLRKDALFLRDQGIMDYSLLLGVHRRKFRLPDRSISRPAAQPHVAVARTMAATARSIRPQAGGTGALAAADHNRVPFFRAEEGGMMPHVIEGPGVFYIGIIDLLQTWTWGKRLERFAKVFLRRQSGDGISAVEPERYFRRFQQRVIKEIIEQGDADDEGMEGVLDTGREASRRSTETFATVGSRRSSSGGVHMSGSMQSTVNPLEIVHPARAASGPVGARAGARLAAAREASRASASRGGAASGAESKGS